MESARLAVTWGLRRPYLTDKSTYRSNEERLRECRLKMRRGKRGLFPAALLLLLLAFEDALKSSFDGLLPANAADYRVKKRPEHGLREAFPL